MTRVWRWSARGWVALNHHQRERSGQHRSSAPAGRCGRRPKLRGNDEHAVIGGVEPHIARPLRGLYVFGDVILVRSVLMNHGERAVRIRGKRVA